MKDEERLFNFFVWFRANGEKYTDRPIEEMIGVYLSGPSEPREETLEDKLRKLGND